MKIKNLPVNSGVEHQRINIRQKRVQKITAETFTLLFVEIPTLCQIVESGWKYPDFHRPDRNVALAWSQSIAVSSPRSRRSAVSRKASACHAGDSRSASSRLNSAHRSSKSFSFSCRGNCWISSALMKEGYTRRFRLQGRSRRPRASPREFGKVAGSSITGQSGQPGRRLAAI